MNDKLYSAIRELIITYDDGVNDYAKLDKQLKKEEINNRVTSIVAQEKRQELQNMINKKLTQINNNVQELLESSMEEQEKRAREQLTKTLNANDTGELMLLGTMNDVTHDDLKNYLEKYTDKPLALRKLKQIAKSNDITLVLNEEQIRMADPMAVINENKNRVQRLVDKNSNFHASTANDLELAKRNSFDFKNSDLEELGKIQKNTI